MTQTTTDNMPYYTEHIKALDGLRGYAAIIVTFYHAILHLDKSAIYSVLYPAIDQIARPDVALKAALVFLNGSTSVLLFYVLSGTVLCHSLLKHPLNIKSVVSFLIRRIFRLFPAVMVCMLVMWLMSKFIVFLGIQFPSISANSALLNALLVKTDLHGPSTSIQVEFLATPFILIFAIVYKRYSISMALVLLSLAVFAIQKPEIVFNLKNMHANTFVFLAGMMVALSELRGVFSKITGYHLMLLLLAGFLFRHLVHFESLPGLIAQVILLASLVGYLRWSTSKTRLHLFLESNLSQFLGKISFSYYLLNVPVLWMLWFISDFFEIFKDYGPLWGGLFSGFVAMMITIPFAYISYKFVERPFIALGSKITNREMI